MICRCERRHVRGYGEWMTERTRTARIDRYLHRLGMPRPSGPLDRSTVAALAGAHGARVPFENLRLHPDGEIALEEDLILRRILDEGQGGLCYELNGAFRRLLIDLGAEVELLGATVEIVTDGAIDPSIPLSHAALRVRISGDELHVDVGFGGSVLVRDVAADGERVVADPGRRYVIDGRPRELADFTEPAHWHSSDPGSRFQRSMVCSLALPDGLVTLSAVPGEHGLDWRFSEHGTRRDITRKQAQTLLHTRFGMDRPLPTELHPH